MGKYKCFSEFLEPAQQIYQPEAGVVGLIAQRPVRSYRYNTGFVWHHLRLEQCGVAEFVVAFSSVNNAR